MTGDGPAAGAASFPGAAPRRGPSTLASARGVRHTPPVEPVTLPVDRVPPPARHRYDHQPRLVFWETTKACPLACVHCRAVAQPAPAPGELTTDEGIRLIDELGAGPPPHPVLVLTGGDCLMRSDLLQLAARARAAGVPVAIAPAVSPRLSDDVLASLRSLGVRHLSISLDGATAATHEGVRQVPGHFAATLDAISRASALGFQVQVNTAVMRANVEELADVAVLLRRLGVRIWEVFFLVTVGRGTDVREISPGETEDVCHFLVDVAQRGFVVRTVEGPFFRRVQTERASAADTAGSPPGSLLAHLRSALAWGLGPPVQPVVAPSFGTRDGKGVIFVAHNGDVFPSGFLPLPLGNVRNGGLLDLYRDHPLLRSIRAGELSGRCGTCEHTDLCGGSRARAFAATGDPLSEDPACALVS